MDWLENSNSSVSLDGEKLAQLIGNRQKLQTGATCKNFFRQISQFFSARKVHNRTVPLCYVRSFNRWRDSIALSFGLDPLLCSCGHTM